MPFKEDHIRMLMGGSFSLDNRKWTPRTLAAEFRSWADELDKWDEDQAMTAEFNPGQKTIDVTMEQGMPSD